MKHIFFSILFSLSLISAQSQGNPQKSQIDLENEYMIANLIDSLLKDPKFNKPYPVSANHDLYKDQSLKIIALGDYEEILKIANTDCFYGFFLVSENGLKKIKNNSSILDILSKFNKLLDGRDVLELKPRVTEEFYLGDFTRVETWDLDNRDFYLTACFTNGQLNCFHVKLKL
jgi:hypothetical protein